MPTLLTDVWTTSGKQSDYQVDPSLAVVLEALARLDGGAFTELSLEETDGALVSVGGGPDRFLVWFGLPEDQGEWILTHDPAANGTTELAIGGSLAAFPLVRTATRDIAAASLSRFWTHSGRHPGLIWIRTF